MDHRHPCPENSNWRWRRARLGRIPRFATGFALGLAGLVTQAAEGDFGPTIPPDPFVVFFPPLPTVYGMPIPEPAPRGPLLFPRALVAPEELADFVGESFYPVLSTRLFAGNLGKPLQARVDAYRTNRSALLNELMEKVVAVQHADPAALARELQAFAPQQKARTEILEQEAEQLRRDVVRGGLFTSTGDWNATRAWRIGDADLTTNPLKSTAEFQAVRAAAYYQDGLGIEQRGLLRELTIDLARAAKAARNRTRPATDEVKAMFFSPETARLELPAGLPPDLVTKIGRFNGEKAALKQELFAAVLELDRASNGKRTSRFTALTEKQWPRVSALETLAEEIRVDLAAHGNAPLPWLPPISAALRERIESYTRDHKAIATGLTEALARARVGALRSSDIKGDVVTMTRERMRQEYMQRAVEERAKVTAEYMRQLGERLDGLQQRYRQIRAELTELAAATKDPRTGQPMTIESLLSAYHVAMDRFDLLGREDTIYSLYKTAMLQPGLAPAQRRLLFGAAQVSLAQALPAGESTITPLSRPRLW